MSVCNTKKRTNVLLSISDQKAKLFRLEKLADKSESIRLVAYFVCVYILFYLTNILTYDHRACHIA